MNGKNLGLSYGRMKARRDSYVIDARSYANMAWSNLLHAQELLRTVGCNKEAEKLEPIKEELQKFLVDITKFVNMVGAEDFEESYEDFE